MYGTWKALRLWASFLLYSMKETGLRFSPKMMVCAHPQWFSRPASWHLFQTGQFFLQGTFEEGQEKDTDWLRGEGCISSSVFTGVTLMKEVVWITPVVLTELAGPQLLFPWNGSILQLLLPWIQSCSLISTSWLKASGGQVLRLGGGRLVIYSYIP